MSFDFYDRLCLIFHIGIWHTSWSAYDTRHGRQMTHVMVGLHLKTQTKLITSERGLSCLDQDDVTALDGQDEEAGKISWLECSQTSCQTKYRSGSRVYVYFNEIIEWLTCHIRLRHRLHLCLCSCADSVFWLCSLSFCYLSLYVSVYVYVYVYIRLRPRPRQRPRPRLRPRPRPHPHLRPRLRPRPRSRQRPRPHQIKNSLLLLITWQF